MIRCRERGVAASGTPDDFRHVDGDFTGFSAFDPPADVEGHRVELVASLGLSFGCIDVILTPEGEYVYLELNSNGQWAWVEKLTGLPISMAIADWLAEGEHAPRRDPARERLPGDARLGGRTGPSPSTSTRRPSVSTSRFPALFCPAPPGGTHEARPGRSSTSPRTGASNARPACKGSTA
ncbi:hypothetical protein [Spongiactinospora sp. TRM90649]|uniref:hypothetical protein n=1 Tax=Spongiactinospora sp. TRM90649 TaxID=3031114 RepID=UPI0023F845B2|nr:hypothetical protein [Spongiactinospora sp. TRM90649]MDF5752811.1 hypothetical protein [Spongiactinospora sp. TRM90649]